jgi:hypothetical protein
MSSAVCRVGTEGSEMRSALSEGEVRSSLRHPIAAFSRPTADLKPVGTHDATRDASSNGYIPPIFYYTLQYIESTALVTYSFSTFSLCVSCFFFVAYLPCTPAPLSVVCARRRYTFISQVASPLVLLYSSPCNTIPFALCYIRRYM